MFNVNLPDDFMKELTDCPFEDVADNCLRVGGAVLENFMKKVAKSVVKHPGESDMVKSIKVGEPTATRTNAHIISAGPKGKSTNYYYKGKNKRRYSVSNALKAIWIEYGIHTPHHHQAARPFIDKATREAEDKVLKAMQEEYDRQVKW